MATNYTGGLNFSWPTKTDTSWDTTVDAALTTISAHDHTGSGNGGTLTAAAYGANTVGGPAIRLANNVSLRGLNAAGSADVNIIRVGTGNAVEFPTIRGEASTETLVSNGAVSVATTMTLVTGGTAFTLADATATAGQLKIIVNSQASTIITVTPATTTWANTVAIMPGGILLYRWSGTEWRPEANARCVVTDDTTTITSNNTYTAVTKNWICNKGSSLAITLSNGVEGQELQVTNIGAGTATITPATTAGTNTAAVVTNGFVRYVYLSGEWRATAGAGCTLS